MKTGNLIASAVFFVWGGAVLVYAATSGGSTHAGSSYQAGQVAALVFALVMLAGGARGVRNELRKRHS